MHKQLTRKEELIFISLGEASMAWSETPTGIFDSLKARRIGEKLIKDMPDYLNQVEEFHLSFDHPVLNRPAIPAAKRVALRISLLEEELKELKKAIAEDNLIEVADAFADLQYVLSGAILEFGLKDKFEEIFQEVHSSNMSKSCATLQEAEETILKNRNETSLEYHMVKRNDRFFVYRSHDMKTIKSINYRPVNIKAILYPGVPFPEGGVPIPTPDETMIP